MKIIPLAFDSFSTRSMATYVETSSCNIIIDPGISIAPSRYGLPPHPIELKRLGSDWKKIKGFAKKADVFCLTHYHYDHHVPDEQTISKAIFSIVREATSTCEIIYETIKDYISDKKILEALLAGIIYDSRRFLINPKKSISLAYELINKGVDIEKILQLLSLEQNFSEKMAKIKGCSRMRIFKASSWIIAFTHVSAFEASVARTLIDIGADLAFVINESEKRLTGRVREIFYNQTGLNLVTDIIRPLIKKFSGQGGGHPTAASMNLNILTEDLISEVLELVANKLKIQKHLICEINTKK